jgi:hypothetical protein
MRKAVVGVVLAILVATSLGVGYLAGSSSTHTLTSTSTMTVGAHTVTSTSTTIVVSSATIDSTVTSTLTVGVPINASDIASSVTPIGGDPQELVLNPNDSVVYVTQRFSDNLSTLDTTPLAINATTLPSSSDGIAIDDSTGVVYVAVAGGLEEINTSLVSIYHGDGVMNELNNRVVGVLPVNIKGSLTFDSSTHVIYGTSGSTCVYLDGLDFLPVCSYLTGVDVRTGAVVANVSLGYPADSISVDPETGMVFAAGCGEQYPVCDSIASVVNGTSGRVVATLELNSSTPPTVAVNPSTDLAYVSGDQLVALNGTSGAMVFKVNPLECGGITDMVVIPYLNEVAATVPGAYVLVYDGSTGVLVDMYSLPTTGQTVAFDPSTDQLIVALWPADTLIAFNLAASRGSVDSALVNGDGGTCN